MFGLGDDGGGATTTTDAEPIDIMARIGSNSISLIDVADFVAAATLTKATAAETLQSLQSSSHTEAADSSVGAGAEATVAAAATATTVLVDDDRGGSDQQEVRILACSFGRHALIQQVARFLDVSCVLYYF